MGFDWASDHISGALYVRPLSEAAIPNKYEVSEHSSETDKPHGVKAVNSEAEWLKMWQNW